LESFEVLFFQRGCVRWDAVSQDTGGKKERRRGEGGEGREIRTAVGRSKGSRK
jgi:hypothetical protein